MACTEGAPSDFRIGDLIDVKYKGMFKGQYVYESKQLGTYASGNYAGFTLPDQGIVVGDGVFSSGKKEDWLCCSMNLVMSFNTGKLVPLIIMTSLLKKAY